MTTIQVTDRTRDELMQRKHADDAPSLDAVVWELLHPRPRKDKVVTGIRRLRRVLEDLGATQLHLFGSVQRDAAVAGSDVDLIVELAPGRHYLDLARIQMALEDGLGVPCDVVPPGGLHPRLADGIWAQAEALWHG
jgi:predicted nucleotidyltransferase